MGWLAKAVLVVVAAAAVAHALAPEHLDCTGDDPPPKCKPRPDLAKIPNSEEYYNMLKDILALLDRLGLLDPEGIRAKFESEITSALAQLAFIQNSMKLRQDEIDEIALRVLPREQRIIEDDLALARDLRTKLTAASSELQQLASNPPANDYISEHRKLIGWMQKLHDMRDKIEMGEVSQEAHTASLIQQSNLLQEKLRGALANSHIDDDAASDDVALLETGLTPSDKVIRLLDETIELFKQQRTLMRDEADTARDDWNDQVEHQQWEVEDLMSRAAARQSNAFSVLAHSQDLRGYLRGITASQYGTLDWYNHIKHDLYLTGQHMDSYLRLSYDTLPVFDELLFLLKYGDQQYHRNHTNIPQCVDDACGVCGGEGRTCLACDGVTALPNGPVLDVCGVCSVGGNGTSCAYFCDGVPNSGKMNDVCGECNGNDMTCAGCDGIIHSNTTFDRCGKCGGDGVSCAKEKGCYANIECHQQPQCPDGQRVTSKGFKSCCFDSRYDCVDA